MSKQVKVAIPIPDFLFKAIMKADELAVVNSGYPSRYPWTAKQMDFAKRFDKSVVQQMQQIGGFYVASESNGLVVEREPVQSFEELQDQLSLSCLCGFDKCHVPFAKEAGAAEDVFGAVRNQGHSDWDDYLWAAYNNLVALVTVPSERCLIPSGTGLCLIDLDSDEEREGIVVIPYLYPKEVLEYFVQVEDPTAPNGERAWVSLTDPDKIVWGSGHGYAEEERRPVLRELAKPIVAEYLELLRAKGDTSVFH